MSRTVNGERLFGTREKEVLRKMLWQVADFSGVEVLTYALMGNHFHVLVRVPDGEDRLVISDAELLRRWRVLYPKPTKYETATLAAMERTLQEGGGGGGGAGTSLGTNGGCLCLYEDFEAALYDLV